MNKFGVIVAMALAATGCGRDWPPWASKGETASEADGPSSLPPREDVTAFDADAAALTRRMLVRNVDPQDQIAVRRPDGTFDDQGDAGIFTGLAVASLGCTEGAPLLGALLAAIDHNDGMIPRHDPLVESANGPTTRDQVVGVMLGFVERWQRCPDDREAIRAAWQKHIAYVDRQNGSLGPTADGAMLTLRWLWGAVGQYFAAGGGGGSKQEFEAAAAATANKIRLFRNACYPIHVETLEMIIAAKIGQPVGQRAFAKFCGFSKVDLGLTEWLCGREKAADWLAGFAPDRWVYAHQRCPAWENPDAKGATTPGLDALLLWRLAQEG